MPTDPHTPRREKLTRTVKVVIGYKQHCVMCNVVFKSRKPADTCSEACKQKRKRARAAS